MTPRRDLGNEAPRSFLHRGRSWVERELHNRETQWTHEGTLPRPLDRDTFAYRYGPLGRHEVVMYFDLCREVIKAAWKRIFESPDIGESVLASALHDHAAWWLAEASIDDDPMPPATIIEHERRKMPLVGDNIPLDDDCPICRMQADGGFGCGPMFIGFDGHQLELDDEFAFSLCDSREQWEEQQEDYRQFSQRFEENHAEGQSMDDPLASAWKTSYVNDDARREAGGLSPLSVMALAMRVAELVGELSETSAHREFIEPLNNAFSEYRSADRDHSRSAAAKDHLADILEHIAATVPQLTARVADFQGQLDERQRELNSFPN